MTKQTVKARILEPFSSTAVLLTALSMLLIVLTPIARATPIMFDVYGAPYFSLPDNQATGKMNPTWMVLAPSQSLGVEWDAEELSLTGPQTLTVRDRSGQLDQFGLLDMSLSLPGTGAVSTGVIDYLMGDLNGSFTILQVVERVPVLRTEASLSIFFWGIDYVNGFGLVLGLESLTPVYPLKTATAVNEPSLLLLLLAGLFAYFSNSRGRAALK